MAGLTIEEVSVRFGGLQALDRVTMTVEEGEVTGLIGPNGAGKTTLFNVVTGLQVPTHGRIRLDDRDLTRASAHRRARYGLGRTFQRLEAFESLTVRENVEVAAEARSVRGRQGEVRGVDEVLELVGVSGVADERVDTLPTGMARLIEMARAIVRGPRILLCDECSSGLTDAETETVGEVIGRLADEGVGVLLVEHDMSFVMRTCHEITVLDLGKVIASGPPAVIQADPAVREAYLGTGDDEKAAVARRPIAPGPVPVVEFRGVSAGYGTIDVVHDIDLTVERGEVVALLGPNGAGKSTLLKVLDGQVTPSRGDVLLMGRSVVGLPMDALARAGVCTIPEGKGIFPNLTVDDNLRMSTFTGAKLLHIRERAFTQFPLLEARRKQLAGTLSGGEQQMLALARALVTDPALLVIDELSMGLAPVIVEQLYEIVAGIAATESIPIIIVEQFAHDVLRVATRAGVMVHGRLVAVGAPEAIAASVSDAYLASSA